MNRRAFLFSTAATFSTAGGLAALPAFAQATGAVAAPRWREFEITYRVTLANRDEAAKLWLPLPHSAGDYQRAHGVEVRATAAPVRVYQEETSGAPILQTEWAAGAEQTIEVVARVATRDRIYDPSGRSNLAGKGDARELALYLKPSPSMPTDGIVGETARKITSGIPRPADRARAIYDWVVDNTFRNPKTRGCGLGDIKFMLETGDLGGKCADINSLYVGLARAAGLPAREIFGIRAGTGTLTKSLSVGSSNITRAQHCRAEVHLPGQGWVAVDPADVRKVVLEEEVAIDSPHAQMIRKRLFGNWEMNWVGFNYGRDFRLTVPAVGTQTREPISFFMYPHAETAKGPLDHLDPDTFKYQISSREITAKT